MKQFNNLISELKNKPITLDCNVFLLLVIGSIDKKHIGLFKRTQIFSEEDYDALIKILSGSQIFLTPNVVTEASNLLESYTYNREKLGLSLLKDVCINIPEVYEKSITLTNNNAYLKFGLSDSSIANLCNAGIIAITVDLELYGYLNSKNFKVINFNHLRSLYILK